MSNPTNYAGIDYSLGRSNYNTETGIHFGVISMNSVSPECTNDFEPEYGEPHCPKCGNVVIYSSDAVFNLHDLQNDGKDTDWFDQKDYTCIPCETCYWSDAVYPDESQGFTYDSDGYKLADCLDNDIFILESPYYTFAQYCSPCVPGAGNLDSPFDPTDGNQNAPKTYCLGPDWFDADNPMPYCCYSVADNSEVSA